MHDCPHCEESFDSERASLQHRRAAHPEQFGSVDRRRLEQLAAPDDGGISTTALLLAGLALAVVGIVVYVTFFLSGSTADSDVAAATTPTNLGGAHTHGTMDVVVLGDAVDFSQQQYQLRAQAFHFEGGEGRVWHVHAERVTLEWAMASLGIEVTESSVTYQGTTYTDGEEYAVSVTVNGQPVDPSTHVLDGVADTANVAQGDQVRIVVERA